jgi:hypothetical protein
VNVIIPIIVDVTDEQAQALRSLTCPVWFASHSSDLVLALLRSASPTLQE